MKQRALWKWIWELKERGDIKVTSSEKQLQKKHFVEQYLSPTIKASNCGWHHCTFEQWQTPCGVVNDYVCLHSSEDDIEGGLMVSVNYDSLYAIMADVIDALG